MDYCTTLLHVMCLISSVVISIGQRSQNDSVSQNIKLRETRPLNFSVELTADYNKKVPPEQNDEPAVVNIDMSPWKIGEISVERMTFEVDLYMTIFWEDYRLTFLGNDGAPWWRRAIINTDEANKIWKPVLNFRNVMGSKPFSFEPNFVHLRLTKNSIFFMRRKVEKFHCHFDLRNFPFDTQSCAIEIQALTYKSAVVLKDNTSIHELRGKTDPPQFAITHHSSGSCTRQDGASKFYSCIEYKFVLRRQVAHHLMLTYAPSFLIVLLSWISFWLDVEATPARIGLGLTSLLTLATQFSNAQKNLPAVAYIKALDIWMFTCIFMVFGSITEFAIANHCMRRSKKQHVVPIKTAKSPPVDAKSAFGKRKSTKCRNISVDEFARVAFPCIFCVFNLCYWIHYGSQ